MERPPANIAANGQSAVDNLGTAMDSQSSQLSTVGSSMQSMMSGAKAFTGAGTILEPLISLTGPGIMSTIFDIVGNTILNSIIMPLMNQFNTTNLENDVDTLTAPLGGTNQTVAQMIGTTNQAAIISENSGATNQHYSSGGVTTSTGSKDPTGGRGIYLQDTPIPSPSSSSSSSTGTGTEISDFLRSFYSTSTAFAVAIINDGGLGFGSLIDAIGVIINAFNTIIGSTFGTSTSMIVKIDIGLLSTISDLLGLGKTKLASFTKAFVQRVRLDIDCYQTILSALNLQFSTNNDEFNTMTGIFWLIKSGSSIISDFFSYLDDLTSADSGYYTLLLSEIYSHASPYLLGLILSTKKSWVSGFTLMVRIVCSIVSAIIIDAKFLFETNPQNMSTSQYILAGLITAFLTIESIAKCYLYYNRFDGADNVKTEQLIYGSSAVLDIVQLIGTLTG